jgi:hypothetical protein
MLRHRLDCSADYGGTWKVKDDGSTAVATRLDGAIPASLSFSPGTSWSTAIIRSCVSSANYVSGERCKPCDRNTPWIKCPLVAESGP